MASRHANVQLVQLVNPIETGGADSMRWLLIILGLAILARIGYYVAYEHNPVPAQLAETIAQLRQKDPVERSRAAQLLGQQGGPLAIAPLIAALDDTDPRVRRNVASALGEIGPDAAPAVPALMKAMAGDDDDSVRANSSLALGAIGSAASADLIVAVRSANKEVRGSAFRALEAMGPEAVDVLPDLIAMFGDPDFEARQGATQVLIAIGPATVPAARRALADPNPKIRMAALELLGKLGPQATEAWSEIVVALADPDPRVREAAVTAAPLVASPPKNALPQVLSALKDSDARVRYVAAISLGSLGPDGAAGVAEILAELEQSQPESKPLLIEALGKIGPEARSAVPAMITALQVKDDNGSLNATTVEALSGIGPDAKAALPILIESLDAAQSADEMFLSLPVIQALGKIGPAAPAQVSPALLRALPKSESESRTQVLQALANLGPATDDVVRALIANLNDENFEVADAAAISLGRCGTGSSLTLPAFIEALQSPRYHGRRQSIVDPLVSYGEAASPAVPALIAGFANAAQWDDESRAAAARALAAIAPSSQEACAALVKELLDPLGQEIVRVAAAEALTAFAATSAEAAAALKEAATSFSGPVQEAASKALEASSDSQTKPAP